MPLVTDRINQLLGSSSSDAQAGIASSLASFGPRLDALVAVDLSTGQAEFEEALVRSAAEELARTTSYTLGTNFADEVVASLQGGFAVLGTPDQPDMIPWRSLTDPAAVSNLSTSRLQALGVTVGEPDVVQAELRSRFPNAPALIDTMVAGRLSNVLREQRVVATAVENETRLASLLPQKNRNGGGDGGGGGEGGDGGLDGILVDIAKAVPDWIKDCFPTMRPHWATWTTGIGVELNRDCTMRLITILRAGGFPTLAAAGAALIAGAAVGAAVAAVGGWPALIVAACVVVFSGWLELVVGDLGAVIHFPWWAGMGPIPYGLWSGSGPAL
jgi:hypothetical protein